MMLIDCLLFRKTPTTMKLVRAIMFLTMPNWKQCSMIKPKLSLSIRQIIHWGKFTIGLIIKILPYLRFWTGAFFFSMKSFDIPEKNWRKSRIFARSTMYFAWWTRCMSGWCMTTMNMFAFVRYPVRFFQFLRDSQFPLSWSDLDKLVFFIIFVIFILFFWIFCNFFPNFSCRYVGANNNNWISR